LLALTIKPAWAAGRQPGALSLDDPGQPHRDIDRGMNRAGDAEDFGRVIPAVGRL
jgi:hypothetical protein